LIYGTPPTKKGAVMAQEKPRQLFSHANCDHENNKAARKKCRNAQQHAECDHGPTGHELAWCTRRKSKAAE
jgi:hypothetical protein